MEELVSFAKFANFFFFFFTLVQEEEFVGWRVSRYSEIFHVQTIRYFDLLSRNRSCDANERFINWKPVTTCVDRRNNEGGNSFAKWHMEKEMKSWGQNHPVGDSLLMVISRGESSADLAIAE